MGTAQISLQMATNTLENTDMASHAEEVHTNGNLEQYMQVILKMERRQVGQMGKEANRCRDRSRVNNRVRW